MELIRLCEVSSCTVSLRLEYTVHSSQFPLSAVNLGVSGGLAILGSRNWGSCNLGFSCNLIGVVLCRQSLP